MSTAQSLEVKQRLTSEMVKVWQCSTEPDYFLRSVDYEVQAYVVAASKDQAAAVVNEAISLLQQKASTGSDPVAVFPADADLPNGQRVYMAVLAAAGHLPPASALLNHALRKASRRGKE